MATPGEATATSRDRARSSYEPEGRCCLDSVRLHVLVWSAVDLVTSSRRPGRE